MPYAEHKPYDEGHLKVSDIHDIHYMQCGNPAGPPVVFLHGGPGGLASVGDTIYFDPKMHRVILFSQRGCGKSTPAGETRDNTTWNSVADIEALRKKVGVTAWKVFGGSWGSTLALAYAQTHPDRVQALILRGIFLFREHEVDFFWRTGTRWIWPAEWEEFASPIDKSDLGSFDRFVTAYHRLLTHPDDEVSLDAAKRWSRWESQVARMIPDAKAIAQSDDDIRWARTFALMECHYAINKAFMPDGHLIEEKQIAKIRHIPTSVVQGRYDMVCPVQSAHDLAKAWGPGMNLFIVPDAGHSAKETGTAARLTSIMDEYGQRA